MRGTPVRFTNFAGGVNTKAAAYTVAENESRDVRNFISNFRGCLRKRNGNLTFCSTFTGTPTNLMSLYGLNTGATVLITTGGTKMYSISTGGVSTDITGAASITSNARWEFAQAPTSGGQGPLYGVNGIDTPKQWTGSGNIADWTASVGSVPNGKYILYFKNRVWIAGTTANPSRLYFSDLADPRSWTATNVVDFDPGDGQSISGIGTIGPYLLVFKQTKTFVVYDLDTGANRILSSETGCFSHRSIVETPNGTYFLTADRGVYITNGQSLKQISEKITPTLDSIVVSQRQNAAGKFFNNHYYLSVCTTGSTNNITLDYDVQLDSWWFHTNTANQFALWRPSAGLELYAAQSNAAIVDKNYVDGVFQDNGASFTSYWQGPWFSFKEPYRRKRVRRFHTEGEGTIDVYMSKDFTDSPVLLGLSVFPGPSGSTYGGGDIFGGSGIFGDPSGFNQAKFYSLGVGRVWSPRFEANAASESEVESFTFNLTPRAD